MVLLLDIAIPAVYDDAMGIEDYIARIVNGVWLWSGDMAPNGLIIDKETL